MTLFRRADVGDDEPQHLKVSLDLKSVWHATWIVIGALALLTAEMATVDAVIARRLLAAGMPVAPGEARVRRRRRHDGGDGDVVEGEIVDD